MAIGSRYNPGSVPDYLGMANSVKGPSRGQQLMNTYDQGIKSGERVAAIDRRDAARSEFASAWESGDQRQIERVMGMFPEYAKDIQNMIGIRDEQHRKDVGSAMMQVNTLASMGDAQGVRDYVRQNTKAFDPAMIKRFDQLAAGLESPKEEVRAAAKQQIDETSKGFILSTMKPGEIMNYGLSQQQMANQLKMHAETLAQQLQISKNNQSLGWARLKSAEEFRNTTPTQRLYEWFSTLSPEEQKVARGLMLGGGLLGGGRGGAPGGMQKAQLADGRTVDIFPKVYKQGSTAFYQGLDENGDMITVPVDSVVTAAGSSDAALKEMTDRDFATLMGAADKDLTMLTGALRGGGVGQMPVGADIHSGHTNESREIYSAALRTQGLMQNQGISAARAMGASGINTVAEAKMFFQSMPQLDFSNEKAFKESVLRIREYTDKVNSRHNISIGDGGKDAKDMSDEELLKEFK